KVWSPAKSAGEVERGDEDSGRTLPVCARAVAVGSDREIDSAISVRMRIKFPESCKRYGYLNMEASPIERCVTSAWSFTRKGTSVQVVRPFRAAYCKLRLPVPKPSVCLIAGGFPNRKDIRF